MIISGSYIHDVLCRMVFSRVILYNEKIWKEKDWKSNQFNDCHSSFHFCFIPSRPKHLYFISIFLYSFHLYFHENGFDSMNFVKFILQFVLVYNSNTLYSKYQVYARGSEKINGTERSNFYAKFQECNECPTLLTILLTE